MMHPSDTLRAAVIGLGPRGSGLLPTMTAVPGMRITAICDLDADLVKKGSDILKEHGVEAECFQDYHEIIRRKETDLVFVITNWISHIPITIDFLRAGIPTAAEVCGASSLRECWELVRAQEESGTPFMFLENCCFGRLELAALRLAREGVLGRVEYAEGAYCHDIRYAFLNPERHRVKANIHRHGDLYPTHSIGAVSKILRVNCGNRLVSVSSMGSPANGMRSYFDRFAPDNPMRDIPFACEDVTCSLIRCAGGELIFLKHNVLLPRPYSRGFLVQGTLGIISEDKDALHIESAQEDGHRGHGEWQPLHEIRDQIDHPLWRDYAASASDPHGGMDFLELRDFVRRVRGRLPMAVDVYDAAAWMCLTPLSAQSIEMGGAPQAIPDFTDGKWAEREEVPFV